MFFQKIFRVLGHLSSSFAMTLVVMANEDDAQKLYNAQ